MRKKGRKLIIILPAALLAGVIGVIYWSHFASPVKAVPWATTMTAWSKRTQLTLVNNSGQTLNPNTTYQVTVDTKSLSKIPNDVLGNCNDVHIVYQPSSTAATDLPRNYTLASNAGTCNDSTATIFSFPLQAAITNGSSDNNYYLYYSNRNAAAYSSVTALSGYDTTPGAASFAASFNGTTTAIASGTATPTTATGAIRYSGGKTGIILDGFTAASAAPISISANSTLYSSNALTVEMWFIDTETTPGNTDELLAKGDTNGNSNYNLVFGSGGGNFTTFSINGGSKQAQSGATIRDGKWHHVAGVFDGSTVKVYVDGVVGGTTASSATMNTDNGLGIGIGATTTGANPGKAIIDEIRVSNFARYTANFTPQTSPFVRDGNTMLLMHFDENGSDPRNASKAFDDSGNNNTGTLQASHTPKFITGLVGVDDAAATVSGQLSSQSYAGHQGVFIEEGTTNLVLDPSFENSNIATNWTASAGGTLTQDLAPPHAKFGATGAQLVPGASAGSALTSISGGSSATYTLSAYVYDGTSGNVGGTVGATIAKLVFNNAPQTTTYTDAGGGWWRLTFSGTGVFTANYGVEAEANKTIFIDGVQLEQKAYPTTYADGTMGSSYSWSGTANNSSSSRTKADIKYSTSGNNVNTSASTISFWIKPNWNQSDSTSGTYYFLAFPRTGGSNNDRIEFYKYGPSGRFGLDIYDSASSLYQLTSGVTLTKDKWYHVALGWSSTGSPFLYVNNTAASTTPGGNGYPSSLISAFHLGSKTNTGSESPDSHCDCTISDFRVFDNSLTSNQVAQLYFQGLGSHQESAPVNQFSGPEDPLVYYKFDEATGTTAYNSAPNPQTTTNPPLSSGSFNGTLGGAVSIPTWQTKDLCVSTNCLYFEGSSASVSATATFSGIQTVAFWAKPASSSGTIPFISFFNGTGDTSITSSNLTLSTTGFTSPTIYVNGGTTSTLTANQWNYVEVTTGTAITATNPVIGKVGSVLYKGSIDEVKFYGYARTSAQVKADFNSKNSATKRGTGASLGVSTSDPLGNGLVGYWKMDETSGNPADSSGNGDTLTNTNTATYLSGKFGNAGHFTAASNQYMTIADNATLSMNNQSLSISAWVLLDSKPVNNMNIITKSGGAGSSDEYILDWKQSSDRFRFVVRGSGTTDTVLANSVGSPALNKWYFVVGTYDYKNNKISIQVNDNPIDTASHSTGVDDGSGGFFIGTYSAAVSPFDGRIDEVRVYNRLLSPSEMSQLYNFAPGPVVYYRADDRQGATLNDSSGNGLNATIVGNPTWPPGKYGSAINTNGTTQSAYVNDPGTGSALDLTNFTISFWMNATTLRGADQMLITKGDSVGDNNNNYSCRLASSNVFFCGIGTGSSNQEPFGVFFTPTVKTWYYMTMVVDGKNITYYQNGIMLGTPTPQTVTPAGNNSKLTIGGLSDGSSGINGLLDDIKIYNYALTQKQIIADMNGGHPSGGSPIASQTNYWKFDEGYGTTANDSGMYKSAGTLTGMVSPASVGTSGWNPNGKLGNAISFDGSNDYVDFGDLSHTEAISTMSASFWVNPNAPLKQKTCLLCKFQQASAANKESYAIETGVTNASSVLVELSTDGNTASASAETPSGVLAVGTWTHVVVVYDGGQAGTNANALQIYINGRKQNLTFSGTIPAATWSTSSNVRAGASSDSARAFAGSMDELKIYLGALNQSDVNIDYGLGKATQFGVLGTSSSNTKIASNSAASAYCVPGDTASCASPFWNINFEGSSRTTFNDTSGNGRTASFSVLNGPDTHSVLNGKIGMAFYQRGDLDANLGSGYVETSSSYSLPTLITMEAWVYPTFMHSNQLGFISSNQTGTNGYSLAVSGSSGQSSGLLSLRFRAVWTTNGTWTVSNSVPMQQWTHIAVTYDTGSTSNVPKIYINGRLVDITTSTSPTGTWSSPSTPLDIAGTHPSAVAFLGYIDNVTWFNYLRTPAQISWDFNRGAPQSWWKFDECTGTTINDSAGTVSGTLSGGTAGNCNTSSTAWFDGKTGKNNYSLSFGSTPDVTSVSSANTYPFSQVVLTNASWGGWFKPTSSINSQGLVDKVNGFRLYSNGSGFPVCGIYYGAAYHDASAGSVALTLNSWNHVICTYDGTNIKTYINGLQIGSTAETNNISVATSNLNVGSANSQTFTGQADDVKTWNYPLTQLQIALDYNRNSAVNFSPSTGAP